MIVLLFFLDISKLFLFIFEIYLLGGYFLFTPLVDSILISIQLKSNFVINANFSNASAVISIIQVKFSFLSLSAFRYSILDKNLQYINASLKRIGSIWAAGKLKESNVLLKMRFLRFCFYILSFREFIYDI